MHNKKEKTTCFLFSFFIFSFLIISLILCVLSMACVSASDSQTSAANLQINDINDNVINEEGAIETYEELVKMTEEVDPASNSKLKEILADEQEHLQELKDFLQDIK